MTMNKYVTRCGNLINIRDVVSLNKKFFGDAHIKKNPVWGSVM